MFSEIGAPGFILLALLALVLFGPKKLPGLGRAAGRTLREFKNEMSDIMGDSPRPVKKAYDASSDAVSVVEVNQPADLKEEPVNIKPGN
ncbi:twin-arginine translocase TatA/TatE family subunit [Paenibacillus pini]|uniref:Sec-independent protein translocase protein TatA n=1 Tax=Paenibacillus pini JCM 16418 TaxID=1236976 RepID=W7YHQ3_9BACL|nr:twin-arginine translocase TatA/TatE family subunit [Paenibacillus pini]GAF07113.1 twin-arginine translocation protein TatA [Paenibacillus pini JCM 16418]